MKKFIKINDTNTIKKTKISINKVLSHGNFILGPEITKLENELSLFTGSKYCVSVSSGTDALLIALMALDIKSGDEVITSPFSWISTIEVISLLGAKPIFADINSRTFNIDTENVEKVITKRTKAIISVSIFGQCSDMDEINRIAKIYNLPVIEDGAQSFGAKYKNRNSCNLSTIGCTSFFPTKPLGCFGDAGACFTNSKIVYEKMLSIRNHGQKNTRYNYKYIGVNGRMDTIQAAVLIEKLKLFNKCLEKRNKVASYYNHLLSQNEFIEIPYISEFNKSVFAQYTIKTKYRDKIRKSLNNLNIPTFLFYPKPLYKVNYLDNKHQKLVNVEKVCKKVLSLPMNEFLSKSQQEYISDKLIAICKRL